MSRRCSRILGHPARRLHMPHRERHVDPGRGHIRAGGRGWQRVDRGRERPMDAERGGRTPAAALTAYATPADRTRALLAGFQVYLAKPFDPCELVTLVAHLAGRAPSA